MRAIIVCGMPAVGKTTVARILASKLELPVIGGGDILKEIAVEEGYRASGEDWWDTSEGMRFLQKRKGSPRFDKEVDERLLRRADKGDVVITSYTLPWLTDRGVNVWLAATEKSRAERMAKRDLLTPAECAKIIEKRDKENYALYKKLYGIEFGKDLKPFQLVVETDSKDAEDVAAEILEHISSRFGLDHGSIRHNSGRKH